MTKPTDTPAPDDSPQTERGIDGWLHRYSRWKRARLVSLDETSLGALGIRTLYLCVCMLFDGVILPWIVVSAASEFSYPLFAVLVLPAIVVEALVYQKMKATNSRAA